MIIIECEQYEDAWWDARLGVPTVSQFIKIQTATKDASKQQEKYLRQLAVERVTGKHAGNNYQSYEMKQGHETEDEARRTFQFITGMEVRQVGFIFHDEQRKYGASPDGLMEDAGLEIFCPDYNNALECLFNPKDAVKIAKKYQQIQGSMSVTEFKRWFFMMYYPGLKPLIQEIHRDNIFIGKLRAELEAFCLKLAMVTKKLRELQ